LYDIISSFDDHKKQLVQSIGFGGLLMFPALRQINRRFAAWIMSRVDPLSQTLIIEPSKQISFNKDDVERVLGIPSQGKSVLSKQLVNKVSDMYLQGRDKDRRSIKVAQDVIERNYPEGMSEADINAFKVAFVIYVPGKLEAEGFEFGKNQVRRTAMYVVYINKNEQKIEVLCIQISNMLYLKKFLNMTVQRKKYSLLLLGNKLATPIRSTFIINNCWIVGTGFIISTDTWSPSSGMLLT